MNEYDEYKKLKLRLANYHSERAEILEVLKEARDWLRPDAVITREKIDELIKKLEAK